MLNAYEMVLHWRTPASLDDCRSVDWGTPNFSAASRNPIPSLTAETAEVIISSVHWRFRGMFTDFQTTKGMETINTAAAAVFAQGRAASRYASADAADKGFRSDNSFTRAVKCQPQTTERVDKTFHTLPPTFRFLLLS